jgi:hypothetical protein
VSDVPVSCDCGNTRIVSSAKILRATATAFLRRNIPLLPKKVKNSVSTSSVVTRAGRSLDRSKAVDLEWLESSGLVKEIQ